MALSFSHFNQIVTLLVNQKVNYKNPKSVRLEPVNS